MKKLCMSTGNTIGTVGLTLILIGIAIFIPAGVASSQVPTLEEMSPTSVVEGNGGFTLSLFGSDFTTDCVVRLNGENYATSFINASELQASVPALDLLSSRTIEISVFRTAGGGVVVPSLSFVVSVSPQQVFSLDPQTVALGNASTLLKVNGVNFNSQTIVRMNGQPLSTNFVSADELQATIPGGYFSAIGTASVSVFDHSSGGGRSNSVSLPVVNPVPSISSVAPSSDPVRSGAVEMSVNGENFLPGSVVTLDEIRIPSTYHTSNLLMFTLPEDYRSHETDHELVVLNPSPGGGMSNAARFIVLPEGPMVRRISPKVKRAGEGGFMMEVSGAGFKSTTIVELNGSPRPTHFISTDKVLAEILPSDMGTVRKYAVTVRDIGGGARSNDIQFSVVAALGGSSKGAGIRRGQSDRSGGSPSGVFATNYPNPFNPSTKISIELPSMSRLTVAVFDVVGQQVALLVNDEVFDAGVHEVEFQASGLPSGIYYYRTSVQAIGGNTGNNGEPVTRVDRMVLAK